MANKENLIREVEKIQGFDIHKGLAGVDDDIESWLEIIRVFIDTTPAILETLKAQCGEDDSQYTITVHGLKGVCYTVGAMGAGDKAKELELRSREGDTAFVRDNNGNLISTTERLISDLKALLE